MHVRVLRLWGKNWHEKFGENGFVGGNSNTVQDMWFFGRGCGTGGQVPSFGVTLAMDFVRIKSTSCSIRALCVGGVLL